MAKDNEFDKLPNLPKSESFQDFIKAKKTELEEKINSHPRSSSSSAWVIVFILMLSLVALGTFTLSQLNKNNQEISNLRTKNSVAGSTDQNVFNYPPVSGFGFTILPGEEAPDGFEISKKIQQSSVFPTRQAEVTSYINEKLVSGRKLKSGIEVEVMEYDNQYNQQQFAELFVKVLGGGFEITSNDITIPRDFKISRIDAIDKNVGYIYYSAVTADNYYIIKYFNQSSEISELKNLSKFTNNIISWLYLN